MNDDWCQLMMKGDWWLKLIDDKVLQTNGLAHNAICKVAFMTENANLST